MKIPFLVKHLTLFLILSVTTPIFIFAQDKQNKDITQPDTLYQRARYYAFNGNKQKSRNICFQILERDSLYNEALILLGSTYAWDGKYDSARFYLNKVLTRNPSYYDALQEKVNIELWDEKFIDAIREADIGLLYHKGDEDLLIKKARAYFNLDKTDSALIILETLLLEHPSNIEAKKLKDRILLSKRTRKLSVDYTIDIFDPYIPAWHIIYTQFSFKTKVGRIITRLNYANRWNDDGLQFEIDAYPQIKPGLYLYLNFGLGNSVFPTTRAGFEIYKSLPLAFEASLGFRYMNWDNTKFFTSDSQSVMIFTASLGKYYGNFYSSFRTYLTPNAGKLSNSYILLTRRYFSNEANYLGLSIGYGNSPDNDHPNILIDYNTYYLHSYKFFLDYQRSIFKYFLYNIGVGFAYEEYYPVPGGRNDYRNKYTIDLGILYNF